MPTTAPSGPKFITVSQVAQALGVSGETVRKRLASGDLQGEQQTNRRWRVAKASVDASLAKLGNPNLFSAIATGAFTAGGTADLPSGKGTLRFSGGTIKLKAKPGPFKNRPNLKICLDTAVASGTYMLVSGTGAYEGISGSRKFTARFTEVGPIVNGKCSTKANAVASQGLITASGPVSLP
jgi:excisionase family DNA binding protein